MPRRTFIAAAAVAAAGADAASPAAAHPEHESCAGGAPGVAASIGIIPGPGPDFGPFVRTLANAGAANETVALIHEGYCEEHAPGE